MVVFFSAISHLVNALWGGKRKGVSWFVQCCSLGSLTLIGPFTISSVLCFKHVFFSLPWQLSAFFYYRYTSDLFCAFQISVHDITFNFVATSSSNLSFYLLALKGEQYLCWHLIDTLRKRHFSYKNHCNHSCCWSYDFGFRMYFSSHNFSKQLVLTLEYLFWGVGEWQNLVIFRWSCLCCCSSHSEHGKAIFPLCLNKKLDW